MLAREVVEQLLLCDETPLTDEVKGLVLFKGQFARRGPVDAQGRSSRQFELKARVFKYGCSYLIYSNAFDSLSEELTGQIISQIVDVLEGRDDSPKFDHLSAAKRQEILEIQRETRSEFKQASIVSAILQMTN